MGMFSNIVVMEQVDNIKWSKISVKNDVIPVGMPE